MKSELTGFVKTVVAMIKGDDAEVTALKVQRRGKAALEAQVALKKAETIELEDNVDSCKEELALARGNSGELITSNEDYISTLFRRRDDLVRAETELENHISKLEFLKEQLALVKA